MRWPSTRSIAIAIVAIFVALVIIAGIEVASFDVSGLARQAPHRSAMMTQREAEAHQDGKPYRVDQRWISYDRISPLLRRAVLVAEDDAFFTHGGLDWNEIKASARRDLEAHRAVRGGSTITQQLARNLFLGNEKTVTRKLKEVFLAFRLESALSKRRIFELYLNEIEWGDGIFGAEAASQRYFRVSAADLDARQATLLAAIIINPRRFSPLQPTPRIEKRVRIIASRLHRRGAFDDAQYVLAIGTTLPEHHGFFDWLTGDGTQDTSRTARPESAPVDSAAEVR